MGHAISSRQFYSSANTPTCRFVDPSMPSRHRRRVFASLHAAGGNIAPHDPGTRVSLVHTDYAVVLQDGEVSQFGPGQGRRDGLHSVVIDGVVR